MNLNGIFQTKIFKIATITIACLVVLLLIFKLGMFIGYKKANFSFRWGENYHRNFGGPKEGFLKGFLSDKMEFTGSHGVFGQIIKIESAAGLEQATMIVKGKDNVEKIILVNAGTAITRFREKIKSSELKIDDYIVVIGEPNDAGQIEAKLIRVLPPPSPLGFSPKQFKWHFSS